METNTIQTRLNVLAKAMMAKGLRNPDPKFYLRANAEPHVYLSWDNVQDRFNNRYEFFTGSGIAAILDKADAFVAALPSPDETRLNEFMAALGSAIDLGRQNNIEVEFVNPLIATMKRLSENVLTDQRSA